MTVGVEIAILVYNTPRLPEAAGKRTGTCVDKEHVKEVKKKPGDLSIFWFLATCRYWGGDVTATRLHSLGALRKKCPRKSTIP